MKKNQILAFDFGASSGRAMLARTKNGKLEIESKIGVGTKVLINIPKGDEK